jgi:PadR family transcriptional regulator PadR
MYTSEIITELQKIELIVVEGTLYPLLNRLLKEELLTYSWAESTSGPPRKYYQITNLGTQLIQQLIPAWQSYTNSINSLIPKL